MTDFAELARQPAPPLDSLALALAAEFGRVDGAAALERLDGLGREVAARLAGQARAPDVDVAACRLVLHERHGFTGDRSDYGDPRNSMLDVVLERGVGLPITLSVLYVEVARRAGVPLAGVGLPGHFVVGHFQPEPPLLVDPYNGGAILQGVQASPHVRPWGSHETAVRMLNNLLSSYVERGDMVHALHAADLRLMLPLDDGLREQYGIERGALQARLN
jgi:regulator of sirC expression with transglutaminase-like and TPR domain